MTIEGFTLLSTVIWASFVNLPFEPTIFKNDDDKIKNKEVKSLSEGIKEYLRTVLLEKKKDLQNGEQELIYSIGFGCSVYLILKPLEGIKINYGANLHAYIESNISLIIISFFSAFLIYKSFYRLYKLKNKYGLLNRSSKLVDTFLIVDFTARQYLIYGIVLSYCWGMNRMEENEFIYSIIIFITLLTIDDWNIISKYAEDIPIHKIRKNDISKLFIYSSISIALLLYDIYMYVFEIQMDISFFMSDYGMGLVKIFSLFILIMIYINLIMNQWRLFEKSKVW